MSFVINSNFIQFFDFFEIAMEALKNSQKYIYSKILNTLNNQLHAAYIDLEKISLTIDDINNIYEWDIVSLDDSFLNSIDDIKIFKKNISKYKSNDFEITNLYNTADKIHNLLLEILDKIAYKEINILKDKNAA